MHFLEWKYTNLDSTEFCSQGFSQQYSSNGSDNGLVLSGNKPLSESLMASLLTHTCITRPQWVKNKDIILISTRFLTVQTADKIVGLMQERRNSNALAMELRLSCINPSKWSQDYLICTVGFPIHLYIESDPSIFCRDHFVYAPSQ